MQDLVDVKVNLLENSSIFNAIIQSRLDEILVLEMTADSLSMNDKFDLEGFQETGLLFWKGNFKTRPDSPIWRILNMACVDEYIPSSGQFLIRKSSPGVLLSLHIAQYMEGGFYKDFLASSQDILRFAARISKSLYRIL